MKKHLVLALSALALPGAPVLAQEVDIQPETLTVEARISEGEHIYVMDMGISGPSAIYVLNASDLSLEGSIGAGTFSQMLMAPGASTLYTSSVYMKRYTRGPIEAVLEEWDPVTLVGKREIVVSDKLAQTLSQRGALNVTADGAYAIAQNATPATSINIVDLAAGQDLAEVPTPGCWSAYPTAEGHGFTTLCGDGTAVKYSFTADGTVSEPGKSEKIFDSDKTPLFASAVRVGSDLVYVSYAGALLFVDDTGPVPTLKKTVEFTEEGWAPSGYNLMGYHAPSNLLFVTMHANPTDGSHKLPAEEIWAVNMESGAVVGRGEAHGESSITVSAGETPAVIGIDHLGGVHRYEVTVGDSVTIAHAVGREGVAGFPTIVATDY